MPNYVVHNIGGFVLLSIPTEQSKPKPKIFAQSERSARSNARLGLCDSCTATVVMAGAARQANFPCELCGKTFMTQVPVYS